MSTNDGKLCLCFGTLCFTEVFTACCPTSLTCPFSFCFNGPYFPSIPLLPSPSAHHSPVLQALGIGEVDPPPWLINMQRYGPPLSYPQLRIPGLNAPIPNGARYGFGPSEWGKPPVDSSGNPLYGGKYFYPRLWISIPFPHNLFRHVHVQGTAFSFASFRETRK